jgi:hypothetical protein
MDGLTLRTLTVIAALGLATVPCIPARAQITAQSFSPQELSALVAPIALYPDGLLANVLMASTYPLEVVEAVRWLDQPVNAARTSDALMSALDAKDWDPSVKALTAVPQVLRMMDSRLDWMERLGDAFIANQAQVMDAVQQLRRQARANGTLKTDSSHRVIEQDGNIIIEPESTQSLAVEIYEPPAVYGTWLYPDYPPVMIPAPADYLAAPVLIYPVITPLWGWSSWDWRHRNLHLDVRRWSGLDRHHSHVIIGNRWEHDPGRRHRFHGTLPSGASVPTMQVTRPVGVPPPAAVPPGAVPPLTLGDPRRGLGRVPVAPGGHPAPNTSLPTVMPPEHHHFGDRHADPSGGAARDFGNRRARDPSPPPLGAAPRAIPGQPPAVTSRAPAVVPPVVPPSTTVPHVTPQSPKRPVPTGVTQPHVVCPPGGRCGAL